MDILSTVQLQFFYVYEKYFICSRKAALFDQQYSKKTEVLWKLLQF